MSKKFTGITSAGSAIPVYDKDAHSALEQKLDTSAFSSVSGEFATVDDVVAAVSGKADTSAIPSLDGYATQEWVGEQGYLTEVPEGYATTEDVISATSGLQPSGDYASATDLANYQPVSAMTGYQAAGDYLSGNALDSLSGDWNEVSAKLDTTAFSDVSGSFLTTVPDTYLQNTDLTIVDNKITEISGVPLSAGDELPSGVMNTSALGYNAVNEISGYNGSAIAQYGAEKQWLVHDDTLVHAANSAQYALGVNLSAVAQLLGVDETVLFETTSGGALSGSFTENLTNFNYIEFFCNRVNTTANSNLAGSLKIAMVGEGVPSEIMLQAGLHTGPSSMFAPREFFDLTNSGFAWQAGYNPTINRTGTTGTNIITLDFKNFGITKVIGIGRKS